MASSVGAQVRSPELTVGVASIGMETYDGDETYTQLYLPASLLRLAFYMSPGVAIEPTVSINYWSGEGASFSAIGLGAFVPFYFNKDQGATGFYAAPGLGIFLFGGDDPDDKGSQIWFAAEAGKKFRMGPNAALRVAAQFYQELENDDFIEFRNIGVLAGLSVFLK
jgi:hypothetical protein